MRLAVLPIALCAAMAARAEAPPATAFALTGHIAHPRTLTAPEMAALPHVAADLPGHGGQTAHASGVLLWTVLDQAGWVDQPGRKTHWQHVILARGQDGYAVALSIGELDPALEGKAVLVLTDLDGKTLAHPELYVPGDHRAARRVHDLVGVEVH